MRAMRVHTLGTPMTLDEVALPEPAIGEVRLRLRACGVNFGDTLMVTGRYQERPALPFTPGMEVMGVVDALGPGVSQPALGTRVAAYVGHGGFAEALSVAASRCVPVPEAMPDTVAGGFLAAYGTSHIALERARLAAGETLLVLGAAGGVGLTAVELGALMGARVIAAARGAERLARATAAGAAHVLDSEAVDVRAEVKALGGADVVYDPVGGDLFDAALKSLKPEGRIVPIGFASGDIPQIPANYLLVKNLTVYGFYWGAYASLRPSVLTESFEKLFALYSAGRLAPHIGMTVPLAEANEALDLLRRRGATGKVVIACDR